MFPNRNVEMLFLQGLMDAINLAHASHPNMTLLKSKAISELGFKRGLAAAWLLGGS